MKIHAMRFKPAVLVLIGGLWASVAWAQAPAAPAPDTAKPAGEPSKESKDTIQAILDQEVAPPPGAYQYNQQGRRDPFVSLIRPVEAKKKGDIKPGMEGFLIDEVVLKGIVRMHEGNVAMLLGTDGKSYFAKVGQHFYDGEVLAIDAATVTFRQEVTDPLSPVKSRQLKKTLYPSEEARQ